MLIPCNNKGCLKSSAALLNTETMEVLCSECGQVISNISEPMKRTLKSFGQIVRNLDKKAFVVACTQCNANRQVVIDNDNTVCSVCGFSIKVHPAMKNAIKIAGETKTDKSDQIEKQPIKKASRKKQ